MTEVLYWVEQNFALITTLCFLWVVASSAYFAWQRHRAGPKHPPYLAADVRFSEKYVSGSSDKNLFTRMGGANKALAVIVLKDALLIEPMGILKWIMPLGFADLEHYVLKSNIQSVEAASILGQQVVRIEIKGSDGEIRTLKLAIRQQEEFLSALRA
jgi:hypothetical protein